MVNVFLVLMAIAGKLFFMGFLTLTAIALVFLVNNELHYAQDKRRNYRNSTSN